MNAQLVGRRLKSPAIAEERFERLGQMGMVLRIVFLKNSNRVIHEITHTLAAGGGEEQAIRSDV